MENKQNSNVPNMNRFLSGFPWFVFSMAIVLLIIISFVNMDIIIAANLKNYSIYVAVNAIANWSIYFAFKQRSYNKGVSNIDGAYIKNFSNYLEHKGKIVNSQSFNEYITYRENQLKELYISDTARIVGVDNLQEILSLKAKDKKRFPKRDQRSRIYNVQHNVFPRCGWNYNDIMYLGQDGNANKQNGLLAYQDVDRNKGNRIKAGAISSKSFYTVIGAMFAGSIAGTIMLSSDGWVGMVIKIIISILFFVQAINSGNTLGKRLVVIDKDFLGSASITIDQYADWWEHEGKNAVKVAPPENADSVKTIEPVPQETLTAVEVMPINELGEQTYE